MNISRISVGLLIALCSTGAVGAAEQRQESVSPDGKWEVRRAPSAEEPGQEVFVIAKRGSQETSVTLSEEAGSFAESATVIWAPDSKRFAFNYQPGLRYKAVQLFQLDGDKWRELEPPQADDGPDNPITRSMRAQRKKLGLSATATGRTIADGSHARTWLRPDTLLLYAESHETFEIKGELEQVGDAVLVTLKFDANGEWRLARTRLLSKGTAGLTREEREELAKMDKERESE